MRNSYFMNILIGIVFSLFFFSLALFLTFNSRAIYTNDLDMFNVESTTHVDKDILVDTYNTIIDYFKDSSGKELKLPGFSPSEDCLLHFKKVKTLYTTSEIMMFISLVLCIILISLKKKEGDNSYLYNAAIINTLLPFVFLCFAVVNFSSFFDTIRKLFFSNRYYKLNKETDAIAFIFHENYYKHCCLLIIGFWLVCGLGLYIIYRELSKRDLIVTGDEKKQSA